VTDRGRRYSLRLQLTTSCQLRCGYCRPERADVQNARALGAVELARIARLLAELGVDRIRLTGGEPLLDDAAVWIVGRLADVEAVREVTLTTRGWRG
jgi:cyclic pyranopterin phosphate synthase